MAKKKISLQAIEQRDFKVYDPSKLKQTIEVPVKTKLKGEIETIEKKGNIKTARKSRTKSSTTSKSPSSSRPASKSKSFGKTTTIKIESLTEENTIKLSPSGYILIITEKPQAAGKIAAALADDNERKISKNGVSYYELNRSGKKIVVACAVGHLFTVTQAKKSNTYPVFDIGWVPNFLVKKNDFTKKYYSVIEKLVHGASEIIIATDFDVEGEVIGYNIVRFIARQKDAKRMKYSSLTVKELQESYENSHPTLEWGQAIAGETRHFIDWLYGINLSRALMSSIKSAGRFKILSIGRVQGPALNLIVEREKKIKDFKSSLYWQVFIEVTDKKSKIELKHNKDIIKKSDLEKFNALIGKTAEIKTIKTKQSILPPAPFDLTTLQTEAYHNHGITPSQTLQIAQSLYLEGLISYPRTSSQKIPDSMEPKKVLEKLSKNFPLTRLAKRELPVEGKKSDPAHPAIMPTGHFMSLTDQNKKIYDLIVKRFISCFCDNAELENKKIELIIDGLKFDEKGMEIIEKGWMEVYPAKVTEKEVKDFNGNVTIDKTRFEEKETQPPKRYSPASILSELEKRNLGTKATRANILETLYDRNYIKERSIEATELGIRLIDTLKKYSEVIIDEKLTREIEKDMDNIRASKKDLDKKEESTIKKAHIAINKISEDFKKKEKEIGNELIAANQALWDQEKENSKLGFKCPNCNIGELTLKFSPRFKSYFIACSAYPDCTHTYSLPGKSLVKKAEKTCDACNFPMVISIRKGKRPWVLCFNKSCPKRLEYEKAKNDANSNENNIADDSDTRSSDNLS